MAGVSKGAPKRSNHFPSQAAEPLKGLVRLLARQAATEVLAESGGDRHSDPDDASADDLTSNIPAA